jgi:hypothetical protein
MISGPILRRRSVLGLAAGAMLPAAVTPAFAAGPACAGWLTILTVGGLVGAPNRGALDPERDRLFNHYNISFPKARVFSAGVLAGLPRKTVTASSYGRDLVASGPLLHEVLALAAPDGAAKTARLTALDGYNVEVALSDIESQQWVLAMEDNGQGFAIGGLGPLYALRQLGPDEKKTEEEEAKWVHSLFYIELVA